MYNEDDALEEAMEEGLKNWRIRKRFFPDPEVCKRCGRTLKKHERGYHYRCGELQGLW